MLNRMIDPVSWPELCNDDPADAEDPASADARLSEQVRARPRQRRYARAAIEFNGGLPARARQEGMRPVR